jgi:hypothetical protein
MESLLKGLWLQYFLIFMQWDIMNEEFDAGQKVK